MSAISGWLAIREYKIVPNVTGADRLLCANLTTSTPTPVFDDVADPYSFFIDPLPLGGLAAQMRTSTHLGLSDFVNAWDAAAYDADGDGITDADDRAFIQYLFQRVRGQ
ncbi:MAG: hypothetical protein SFZ23_10610 [Planctomycetota bacterium]|nr:hypothetical protein [Planctomycetota bacterium]